MLKSFVLIALCAAVAFGQGQSQFSASVMVYDDPNTVGVMLGSIQYDLSGQKMRVDWQVGGGTVVEYINYAAKLRYLYCNGKCQTETWTSVQPKLNGIGNTNSGQQATINGMTCTRFTVGAGNPVAAVWMNGDTICQADMTTGAKWVFTGHGAVNQGLFSNAGWNCPAQTCNKMIDFILVFDESGSIIGSDFAKEKQFASNFASRYTFGPQDTGMGLILFASGSRIAIEMTYIKNSFTNGVTAVSQRGGSTCIGCGMQTAHSQINSKGRGRSVTRVMLVLTDGQNNVNENTFPSVISAVKNDGIIVFALGVGSGVNQNEIRQISSSIAGVTTAYPAIPSFSDLATILDSLVQATCINIPGNPCGSGCKGFCACSGNCVCPSACDTRNKCLTGTCTAGVNGNGCVYSPVTCNDGNFCTDDYCDPATGCQVRTTVCTPPNECMLPSCVPASGCKFTVKSCEDFDPCTDDTCTPGAGNGGCNHPKIACDRCFNITCPPINCKVNKCNNNLGRCEATDLNCDDGNACTIDTCDVATGKCVNTRRVCNDQNACTKDFCDTKTGCYYVPFNATDCDDYNACTNDTCDPKIGCVRTNITCFDGLACTADICDSVLGCTYPPMDCLSIPRIKRLLGTCYQALCNETRRGCYLDPLPDAKIDNCGVCNGNNACAVVQLPSTVPYVVAGGLLAVVIIGAVIAAIAIVSFAGKKGYDIWLAHKGGISGAANNPLYNDGGLTGVNPTYTA